MSISRAKGLNNSLLRRPSDDVMTMHHKRGTQFVSTNGGYIKPLNRYSSSFALAGDSFRSRDAQLGIFDVTPASKFNAYESPVLVCRVV